MNNTNDLFRLLLRTIDGRFALFWSCLFMIFFVQKLIALGFTINLIRFIFFSTMVMLIFKRFRVSSYDNKYKPIIWGLININMFGFFIIWLEFLK
jgi:hypothetical protein